MVAPPISQPKMIHFWVGKKTHGCWGKPTIWGNPPYISTSRGPINLAVFGAYQPWQKESPPFLPQGIGELRGQPIFFVFQSTDDRRTCGGVLSFWRKKGKNLGINSTFGRCPKNTSACLKAWSKQDEEAWRKKMPWGRVSQAAVEPVFQRETRSALWLKKIILIDILSTPQLIPHINKFATV